MIHGRIYVIPRPSGFVHQHLAPFVGNDTKSYVGSLSYFHFTTVKPHHNIHYESGETQEPNTYRACKSNMVEQCVANARIGAPSANRRSREKQWTISSLYLLQPPLSFSPIQEQSFLSLGPHRPLDPSNGAIIRRASIVWFRNDLHVHDNKCLNSTNNESVADLRKNLQARGFDLVIRIGKPETVFVELAKAIGADAIYAHREVSHDEVKEEKMIEAAMKEENVEVKYFWGSTMYHAEDFPFKLEDMPTKYGNFRKKVKGLEVMKMIEALDQMKGLPSRGDVEPGDVPTLMDLGLNPSATTFQVKR
ncbi:hypothetical protein ACFX2J_003437 [Malus domestica]